MKVFFCLCALLALAAAQCSYEGQTFTNDAETITFGAAVGGWVPSIIQTKGVGSVIFATSFKAATASRVDVIDWATTATERCATAEVGHFSIAWKADCSGFSFHLVSDSCASRSSALVKSAFTVVGKAEGCLAVGSSLSGNLGESEQQPRLSGDSVTFTVGMDGYVLASVADRAVILERWKYESGQLTTVGIGSYPDGFACDQRYKGKYTAAFGAKCAVTLCGTVDSCQSRAQLYNGVQLNGDGGTCRGAPVPEPDFSASTGCSDGRQWKRHPWDCVNQGTKGECFFCKGIAHDQTISMCLERQGGGCNQIFESQAAGAYCNLEFECPASTLAVSSAFLIVSVVLTAFVGFF